MNVKKLLMATILLSGQAYSQSFIETSVGEWSSRLIDYTKEHFSASYHGEIYTVRRDVDSSVSNEHDMKDFKIMHNPTLIYKPSDKWQALATGEFKFSDQPKDKAGVGYPNGFYRALFTLTRKKILTEKENGVQLDIGVGRRQFSTGSQQRAGGDYALASYGNNRAFATLSKSFGKNNASLFLQYLNNDYKKSSATTWENSIEVIPSFNFQITEKLSYLFNDDIVINTPKFNNTARDVSVNHDMNIGVLTYQWNDKISTYYQFKYLHEENFTKDFQSEDDSFSHYVGVGYAFNPKSSVVLEVGSELFHARDGKDFLSKKASYPEMALYLDFAI